MRFMMMVKHAEDSGTAPKEFAEAMSKLAADTDKTGTMLSSGGLAPTRVSTRVRLSGGEISILDGPFTESKEVVGGFAMFELKSKQEAVEATISFMELHKKYWPGWVGETEIRQIFGPEEAAQACK